MITSDMGLLEIPHVSAPASAQDLKNAMREQAFPEIAPFPITFIPGVRNFAAPVDLENFSMMDMMRGEETEAIGLYDLLGLKEKAMLVLPGSHNKFVAMSEEGKILGCMTSISGELLDAMTHHTILADAVGSAFVTPETYVSEMAHGLARKAGWVARRSPDESCGRWASAARRRFRATCSARHWRWACRRWSNSFPMSRRRFRSRRAR